MKLPLEVACAGLILVLAGCSGPTAPEAAAPQNSAPPVAPVAVSRPTLASGPQVLIRTDFGARAAFISSQKAERVSGVLPNPWHDMTQYAARAWVNYEPAREGGRDFGRMKVLKVQDGTAALFHALPALAPGTPLRLQMTIKGSGGQPVFFGIRHGDVPYHYLWRHDMKLAPQWQDLKFDFAAPASQQSIIFILETPRIGQVDLARCELTANSSQKATAQGAFIGTWKLKKTGAIWTFSPDGTCSLLGLPGQWSESKGLLVFNTASRKSTLMRFNWAVSDAGRQLTLTAAPGFAGGQLKPFVFQKAGSNPVNAALSRRADHL